MDITFYGTRGSLPAPRTGAEIQEQVVAILYRAAQDGVRFSSPDHARQWLLEHVPFHQRAGYGADTTSIYLHCGETQVILDAGSGLRRLGCDLMQQVQRDGGLRLDFLFTHLHLDHVIGFPFFAPLFAPRDRFDVRLVLHGSGEWKHHLYRLLCETVGSPFFPVELHQIGKIGAHLEYRAVEPGQVIELGERGEVRARCYLMHHPNETYGWRVEYAGRVFALATDTEPSEQSRAALREMARGADVFYIDAQFDHEQYCGEYDGLSREGWGHGHVEWCGRCAAELNPGVVVMGHHDPAAGNERIHALGEKLRSQFPRTVVGYDGLRVRIEDDAVVAVEAGERGQDVRVPRAAPANGH